MDHSVFMDKAAPPSIEELNTGIGTRITIWNDICSYVHDKYPDAVDEWNFTSKNSGWSFRIKDNTRAIVYLLPRLDFFKIAFIFGEKAFQEILRSDIAQEIKNELSAAREYREGRGIRINIMSSEILDDVKKLVDIKLAH